MRGSASVLLRGVAVAVPVAPMPQQILSPIMVTITDRVGSARSVLRDCSSVEVAGVGVGVGVWDCAVLLS